MKKSIVSLIFVVFAASFCLAGSGKDISFKQTLDMVKTALLKKDMAALNAHVSFKAIVSAKVKNYAQRAQRKNSFILNSAGKLVSFSEPAITAAASRFILSEYSKSNPGLRRYYYEGLHITKVWDNGQAGIASGTFMGESAAISALKINGSWVITSADSPLLDREFKNLLKILHIG